jgi:hypothetical protein
MKHFIILFAIIFSIDSSAYTQTITRDVTEVKKNVAWFSPSKATLVNGVMFNVFPVMINEDTKNWPRINGIEIEISPLSIFFPFLAAIYSLDPETHQPIYDTIQPLNKSDFKEINGLHIGLGDTESKWVNGIDISATGSFDSYVNGASISLIMNKHWKINGISIAVIGNHDIETNGVQISLINSSLKLCGFQIGLWNKNQKRSLPFINWVLKK